MNEAPSVLGQAGIHPPRCACHGGGHPWSALPRWPQPADAAMFGEHVRDCAQSMGFDQDHNPGMHRGISMWDPTHTC